MNTPGPRIPAVGKARAPWAQDTGNQTDDLGPSSVIDPAQKFNEPLIVDPKEDFLIFWIALWEFLITTTEGGADVYPNLTVDQFWVHIQGTTVCVVIPS